MPNGLANRRLPPSSEIISAIKVRPSDAMTTDAIDFFITGTSRSGSTLLRELLDDHPDTAVLNESQWLPAMTERFGTGAVAVGDLLDVVDRTYWDSGERVIDANLRLSETTRTAAEAHIRERVGDTTTVTDFHPAVVDALFNADRHKTVRGDKTPDYGFYMAELQQIWPETRFIHVLRNGISTARSMTRHDGCRLMVSYGYDCWVPVAYDWRRRPHHRFRRASLAACVASWRRRVTMIRAEAERLRPGTYLEIRYEALLTDPALVLDAVCEFLSIEPDDDWLRRAEQRPQHRRPTRHADDDFDPQLFARLELDDLEMLAAVGDVDELTLTIDASPTMVADVLAGGRQALATDDHRAAARAGFSLLAIASSQPDPLLHDAAVVMIAEALRGLGPRRSARSWTGRMAASPERSA